MSDYNSPDYWKKYQNYIRKETRLKRAKKTSYKLAGSLLLLVLLALTGIYSLKTIFKDNKPLETTNNTLIPKKTIRELIKDKTESQLIKQYLTADYKGETLILETTIDKKLQNYLEAEVNDSLHKGNGSPELISIVVIEPQSGKIIGMKGYGPDTMDKNPCIGTLYPAASIFKIVTAAAAVEEKGYSPDTRMWFNGGKYTLYKRQLTGKKNKYTNYIRLKDAFAQSVNPVFGKLGFNDLKNDLLLKYSDRFNFQKPLDSDVPVKKSIMIVDDKKYNWAEIACGFNNSTKISVLHAAMINSAIANKGNLASPYLIKEAKDDTREIRYKNINNTPLPVIKESTAKSVSLMMQRTIKNGTAKGAFRSYTRGKTMKDLVIAGKTGSIFNQQHTIKFDWFTGFARNKKTGKMIAFAIVVGHGEYLGTKAAVYGRRLISNYFSNLT